MKTITAVIIFLLSTSGAIGQDFTDGTLEVKTSWDKAIVSVPGRFLNIKTSELETLGTVDVALFMHGCAGIKSDELWWTQFLNGLGLIVILPDSFANGRRVDCDPLAVGGITPSFNGVQVVTQRVTETIYAINHLKAIPNIRKIFLVGFSRGGMAVLTSHREYTNSDSNSVSAITPKITGIISISSYCRSPFKVSDQAHVLLINFETDPWFRTRKNECAEKTSQRKDVTSVVLPGDGHEAKQHPLAASSVKEFVNRLK